MRDPASAGEETTDWRRLLDLESDGPLYDRLKRAVRARIVEGVWRPGDRLPAESAVADHLDAARMTVNRAFRELAEEGWVVRRRGAGTFVAEPPTPSAMLRIVDMATAIPAQGRDYRYDCLLQELGSADAVVAERLRVEPGAPVRHVICLHRADGEAVELEERWIDVGLLPEAAGADFTARGPGGWLLEVAPWTEAEHTVRAVNAGCDLATRLGIREGAACLVLERRTFQGDRVVTFARLTHPGDRHHLTGRFRPEG